MPVIVDSDGNMLTTKGRARGCHEYEKKPLSSKIRVATFGDCLTFGEGVSTQDTWQYTIEKKDSTYEVLNFGVEAYDPGQMYLWYKESLNYYQDYHVTIFSVVTTNVFKPLNIYRFFYAYNHGIPLGKPGYVLKQKKLHCIPNPLSKVSDYKRLIDNPSEAMPEIGAKDYYFNIKYTQTILDRLSFSRMIKIIIHELNKYSMFYDKQEVLRNDTDAFNVTTALYDQFFIESTNKGSKALFLFLPLKKEIQKYFKDGVKSYQTLIDYCTLKKYPFVDMLEELNLKNIKNTKKLFNGVHYTLQANSIISDSIVEYLHTL